MCVCVCVCVCSCVYMFVPHPSLPPLPPSLSPSLPSSLAPSLTVTMLQTLSFLDTLTRPWALTLISITPSSLRMEPGTSREAELNSIILNVGGRVLMMQRDLPRPQTMPDQPQVHVHVYVCAYIIHTVHTYSLLIIMSIIMH